MNTTRLCIWLIALFAVTCSTKREKSISEKPLREQPAEKRKDAIDSETKKTEKAVPAVVLGDSEKSLKAYYQIPFVKEFYEHEKNMQYSRPPALEIPGDLASLSYGDLRLLRNEVFARNGYLFNDGFLRGYFNRFKWYMPIFDVDTFRVVMSPAEHALVKDILAEESRRRQRPFVRRNELDLYNADLAVNVKQFRSVDEQIMQDLYTKNFSLVASGRQMPFYVYDKNAYQYIPHYITTDLYLFILHKYFSKSLERIDQNFMSPALSGILNGILAKADSMRRMEMNNPALQWAHTYCAIALYAANEQIVDLDPSMQKLYDHELKCISDEAGEPLFLPNTTVNYEELKPRGHYTKSDTLQRYFKAFKWISLNGVDLGNDTQLKGLMSIAYIIKSSPKILWAYEEYVALLQKLAGNEDNLSIRDLINVIDIKGGPEAAISESAVARVRAQLSTLNKERIMKVYGEHFDSPEEDIQRVYLLSGTYSISGDIFSKLIHIDWNDSKRPFPRALDIPAVWENETAEQIISNEYDDDKRWPEYHPRLLKLQERFEPFVSWDDNYGFKSLQTALSAASEMEDYPGFMKTDAYNRKELSTALSSWTHIKHDLILYQEKPYAAQAGQGGGPEPPKHYSFVEPNIEFWKNALSLVRWLKALLAYDDTFRDELQRILDIGLDLQRAATTHIAGKELDEDLLKRLSRIGARIEYTLLGLLETDHLPEREKSMAIIADVYSYNGINLNVAVGHADDIYVIVPIGGEYHIARGSVFSYYEFTDSKIYNDEEWRKMLMSEDAQDKIPDRPAWIAPLVNDMPSPEGQMEYRYPGHWMMGYSFMGY